MKKTFPKNTNGKPELVAPAGDLFKLKTAFRFGADAVYCGLPDFSLRSRTNRFSAEDLKEGAERARSLGKKIYITLNIYAHNRHIREVEKYLQFLGKIGIDGVIVSDPGILVLVKKFLPEVEIHLSTQSNVTNFEAVRFWTSQGISRVILAREVSLPEIREISREVPEAELEYFVHGAMCMSYSGRCLLSRWMTGRSANLGDCAQPCRWGYKKIPKNENLKISLTDHLERFEMEVEEDSAGTYFFNSYDMNLIGHLDKLIEAGVGGFKIEGRAKSPYYLAVTVRAYRKVLDALTEKRNAQEAFSIVKEQKKELEGLVHRGYSTGFLLGEEPGHNLKSEKNPVPFQFVGEVEGKKSRFFIVRMHNALFRTDKLSAVTPDGNVGLEIKKILDWREREVFEAHGGHENRYFLELDKDLREGDLLRRSFS